MSWLPNARRVSLGSNVAGGPYDDMRKPKVCWHMTQGSGLAGARAAFAPYPPHIGYNPATRELEQYVPLDRHSYAFFNGEADDEYIIQIEVVGFSESAQGMPDWQVQNIVDDLVDPLEVLIGVPPVVVWHGFHGAGEGFTLASPDSPIRLSLDQLREFSGHLGHQHIPGDEHWDPGRFRIDEVLRRSQQPQVQEESDMFLIKGDASDPIYVVTVTADGVQKKHITSGNELALLKKISGQEVRVVDQWMIDAPSTSSLVGGAVWNAPIPVEDSDTPSAFRPAHRVVAGIYDSVADVVADVDEEALADALAARGVGGASPAEVKQALIAVLTSVN